MSQLLLQRVNERWAKNARSSGDLGEEVTFVEETWALPVGDPLTVRFCTRKGHPMRSFCKPVETPKTSIVLHHTSGYGHFSGLMGGGGGGIHFMIGRDGNAYRMVDTELVAWHATWWNNNSVGIEIDNIGALREKNGNMLDEYGNVYCTTTDKDAYRELQFRSTKYWATWTESQYLCLGKLLRALSHKHGIPLHLLPEPQRYGAFRKPDDRARFRGVCVHLNIDPQNRDDLGPYVDWNKVIAYAGLMVGDCMGGAPMPEMKVPAHKKEQAAPKPAAPKPAASPPKAKKKPGDQLPPPVSVDARTVKLHVGSRPGRIGLTVQQPGAPVPTSPEFDGKESQPQADGKRDEFLRHAMGFLGTAWKAGSHDPKTGLDGASLVDICLKRVGLLQDDDHWPDGPALAMQYHVIGGDKAEPPGDILPGDLAFFGSGDHDQDSMQHPFIWLGGGRVLGPLPDHGSSNGAVRITHVGDVPDHFAGWSHIDDLGKKTDHTGHPGDAPAGTKLSGVLLPAEPADRYDYLKQVVQQVGGKWSDEKGKVNLVGVQELHELCHISPKTGDWNDTLFANYLDPEGHKCSLELRASLNPGFDPDPAGSWQLLDGGFTFKLDKGDGIEKALVPDGNVKGWFDEQGLGALRPGDAPHGGGPEPRKKDEEEKLEQGLGDAGWSGLAARHGDTVELHVNARDLEGEEVQFEIKGSASAKLAATVEAGKAVAKWTVPDDAKKDAGFTFTASAKGKQAESSQLQMGLEVEWEFVDPDGKPLANQKCAVTAEDGRKVEGRIEGGMLSMIVPAGHLVVEVEGHLIAQVDVTGPEGE